MCLAFVLIDYLWHYICLCLIKKGIWSWVFNPPAEHVNCTGIPVHCYLIRLIYLEKRQWYFVLTETVILYELSIASDFPLCLIYSWNPWESAWLLQAQQGLLFELTEPQGGCWTCSKKVVIVTESWFSLFVYVPLCHSPMVLIHIRPPGCCCFCALNSVYITCHYFQIKLQPGLFLLWLVGAAVFHITSSGSLSVRKSREETHSLMLYLLYAFSFPSSLWVGMQGVSVFSHLFVLFHSFPNRDKKEENKTCPTTEQLCPYIPPPTFNIYNKNV